VVIATSQAMATASRRFPALDLGQLCIGTLNDHGELARINAA
jgi:hypothetical protein